MLHEKAELPKEQVLAAQIKAHWQQSSPRLYRELAARGRLDDRALERARLTEQYAQLLVRRGYELPDAEAKAMHDLGLLVWERQ